jgi:Spx/MgsR family transcriptional regulator
MALTMYAIPNCDTVKKARTWLEAEGIEYAFHDYKKQGADPAKLAAWSDAVGWEALLNRRGTTFRGLSEADKADIDRAKALQLMVANPSLIKRPVIEHAGGVLVGFDAGTWEAVLTDGSRQ